MHMNPVYKNELKMSARSMQIPVLAVIFNSILSVVTLSVLYSIRQGYIRNGSEPYSSMMLLYVVVLTIEVVLLCLFVPSAAGGSIAGERERLERSNSQRSCGNMDSTHGGDSNIAEQMEMRTL